MCLHALKAIPNVLALELHGEVPTFLELALQLYGFQKC